MTAEGHLIFSVACAIFAKKAEVTPELATGDWWHHSRRAADLAAAGHRSPQVGTGPASALDCPAHRPRLRPPRLHPQPAGDRRRHGAVPAGRAAQLADPGRRAARHDHRLLQPSAGRYAHSRRRSAAVAMPLAFSPAAAQLAKGNQLERVLCLCLVAFAICWQGDFTLPVQSMSNKS